MAAAKSNAELATVTASHARARSIKAKAYKRDKTKTLDENIMDEFRDKFTNKNKKTTYDLLASKVSFDMRPDNSIITRDEITRKVGCSHIEVAPECSAFKKW